MSLHSQSPFRHHLLLAPRPGRHRDALCVRLLPTQNRFTIHLKSGRVRGIEDTSYPALAACSRTSPSLPPSYDCFPTSAGRHHGRQRAGRRDNMNGQHHQMTYDSACYQRDTKISRYPGGRYLSGWVAAVVAFSVAAAAETMATTTSSLKPGAHHYARVAKLQSHEALADTQLHSSENAAQVHRKTGDCHAPNDNLILASLVRKPSCLILVLLAKQVVVLEERRKVAASQR